MKNNISSNRDYATENINLRQQIIDLKVANKDKAETIKSMKQELIEYSKLRDRFKVLYEENKKYKQLQEELGCPLKVVFKAIEYGIYDKKGEERSVNFDYNKWEKEYYFNAFSYDDNIKLYLRDYKRTWWLVSDKENK